MLLTKKFVYKPTLDELLVLNSFAYASAKLWNIGNYEKKNYKQLDFEQFPDWYDQKKRLKTEFWYKNLPSQTAQQVLKDLQDGWNSFFRLKETGGIKNPQPPRFKKKKSLHNFTFLNNGFKVLANKELQLTIPKQLKTYLKEEFSLELTYLVLKCEDLSTLPGNIKTIEFIPQKDRSYELCVVYEIEDALLKEDNHHYLSIDMGLSNLFTCYDNNGISFIVSGAKYLESSHYFNKKIAYYQSISDAQQVAQGVKYPKTSKRVLKLYERKQKRLNHYFHSATKLIVDYCLEHNISKVIIGDMKGIRKDKNLGKVTNQKFHSLPYDRIYKLLTYKLARHGIELIKQKEAYSSQVSPFAPEVSKKYATPEKRRKRGLYIDQRTLFNADSVGAFNIMRLYQQKAKKDFPIPLKGLSSPQRLNVSM